jgi:putative hydrolase of the HAD superfamily
VFEAVVTSGDVGFRKPHLLVFETALARLGVSSREAVVVGDSYENDIVPAAKLGIVPVLKLNDREPDPSWLLARYQVRHLRELLELEPFAGSAKEGHGGRRSP